MKKISFLLLVILQLATSCSKSDEPVSVSVESLAQQIDAIVKQPYSKLTPAEQKVKLEAEANDMLLQMDKSKTSGAIEAIQNLGNLLSISSVDILNGKNNNEIEDLLNVSDVFGIYTWNSSRQIWIKTSSTTDLKFIFPAKKNLTTNNASLTCKSTSSNIKVKIVDSYGTWNYNQQTDQYTQSSSINDSFYLPTSVDANLTIDNILAATFATTAKYTGTIETPDESSFKMVLSDGYTYEISGSKKSTQNTTKSSFTYNGKNLVSFNIGSTADIDGLIKDESLLQYRGKANGLIQIMDNFMIMADMDVAGLSKDDDALNTNLVYPDWNKKTYYTDLNNYNIKIAEGNVTNYNKNVKLILVSKKDGTKIADVILRSEKGYIYYSNNVWIINSSYQNGGYWDWSSNSNSGTLVQEYDEILYLKFNDSTEVALDTYFSTGFDVLQTKFENFYKSFENR
jgi:hypothetical protein